MMNEDSLPTELDHSFRISSLSFSFYKGKYCCDFLHCCCFILGLSLLPVRRLPRGKNREETGKMDEAKNKMNHRESLAKRGNRNKREKDNTVKKKNNPETSPNEYPQQSIVNGNSGEEGRGESGEDRVRRSRKREGTLERTETSKMKDGR